LTRLFCKPEEVATALGILDAKLLRLCDEAAEEIRDAGMSQIDADADGCCPICDCSVHDDGYIEPDEPSRCHSCAHDIVARVAGWSPLVSAARESVRLRSQVRKLRDELDGYITEYGVDHDDPGCPEDDTCTCPNVAALNALFAATEPKP
jgi:hypothetical protein